MGEMSWWRENGLLYYFSVYQCLLMKLWPRREQIHDQEYFEINHNCFRSCHILLLQLPPSWCRKGAVREKGGPIIPSNIQRYTTAHTASWKFFDRCEFVAVPGVMVIISSTYTGEIIASGRLRDFVTLPISVLPTRGEYIYIRSPKKENQTGDARKMARQGGEN